MGSRVPTIRCQPHRHAPAILDVSYRILLVSLLVAVCNIFVSRGIGTHLLLWHSPYYQLDPVDSDPLPALTNSSVNTGALDVADVPAPPQPENNKDGRWIGGGLPTLPRHL